MMPIRAEIRESDRASALGVDVQARAPVLALCRALVDVGHDPAMRLEAYRGDTLCLRVRSIGEAAELRVNDYGTGFARRPAQAGMGPARALGDDGLAVDGPDAPIAPTSLLHVPPLPAVALCAGTT